VTDKTAQDEQFPVHFEHSNLRVYSNPSGEVFVEDKRTGVYLRVQSEREGGLTFTTSGRMEPVPVNNMIGWRVEPRK